MNNAFIVSPLAKQDMREIWKFISKVNSLSADKLIEEITSKFSILAQFPEMGRTRNDLLLYLRSFAVKNYLILYQPNAQGVEILRVVHASRDMAKIFDEMVGEL
jgi:toxin ParE1/3/4